MRPAFLYFAQFAVLASPGRFSSLFLSSFGLSDTQIGLVMSIPNFLSLFSVSVGGIIADKLSNGKTKTILLCNVLGSLFFIMLVGANAFTDTQYRFLFICVFFSLFRLLRTPAQPVLDALTLDYLENSGESVNKGQYGRERMWGALGWGFFGLLLGIALDAFGFSAVYVFSILTTGFLGVLLTEGLVDPWKPIGFKSIPQTELQDMPDAEASEESNGSEEDDVAENLETGDLSGDSGPDVEKTGKHERLLEYYGAILSNPRSLAFLFTVACSRMGTALVTNLLFLFFVEDLKASNFLCGVTILITSLSQVPFFYASEKLLRRFGSPVLLIIGMMSYVVRVMIYTFVDNSHAWHVLWVEPLHGVTFSLYKIATVHEMSELTPPHLRATGQSFLSVCSTLGILTGTLGGSYIMQYYGSVIAYRTAALLVAISASLYGLTLTRSGLSANLEKSSDRAYNNVPNIDAAPSAITETRAR